MEAKPGLVAWSARTSAKRWIKTIASLFCYRLAARTNGAALARCSFLRAQPNPTISIYGVIKNTFYLCFLFAWGFLAPKS